MTIDDFIKQSRELSAKATECSVCLSPVIHHNEDEGTQHYERMISKENWDKVILALETAVEQLEFLSEPFTWSRVAADTWAGVRLYDMYGKDVAEALAKIQSIVGGE